MSYTTHNINPKPCAYDCSIQIYWTTSGTTTTTADGIIPPSTTQKPRYYNPSAKKRTPYTSFPNQQPKPKLLSNSFELLTTSPKKIIQKQYEMFSYIVTEHGRRVHGSKR